MGWNFVHCLAPLHELHIITESKYKEDINRYFSEHPDEKHLYHFYFMSRRRYDLLRKIWPPSYYWFYRLWQRRVLAFAKDLDVKENFEVVHALNMAGYREPGFLYKLGKPLVWGPVGGFQLSPWCLLPSMGVYGALYYGSRNLINLLQMHVKRTPRQMALEADAIIAATQDNHDAIERLWKKEAIIIPETGLTANLSTVTIAKRKGKLKLCWSGQHTPAKTLNILLDALALMRNKQNVELHVIGQGRSTRRWQKQAESLHLNNIIWHGWVERSEAWKIMNQCHVFCITSVTDLTSTVLMEALSFGMPIITFDLFGFSNVVTNDCGIKIPVQSKSQVVQDLAKAINKIAENEPLRMRMAQAALNRAQDFTWEGKARQISQLYKNAINAHKQ